MAKKFFVYNLACELRYLDCTKICKYLSINGHEIVNNPSDADIILFLTCGFTNYTRDFCLKKIEKFKKYDAELIVAGCIPGTDKEKLLEIFSGRTLTTKDLDKIDEFFPENKIKFNDIRDGHILYQNPTRPANLTYIFNLFFKFDLIRKIYLLILISFGKIDVDTIFYSFSIKYPIFHLKVCSGCNGNCSYCAINRAIGKLKSKTIDKCVKEFKQGLEKGYKNFVLAADNVGSYGKDIDKNLAVLLKNLIILPGQYNIAIREIGPYWIVKYNDELTNICKEGKITDIGIVVQSGSARILRLMNRYSNVNKIKDAIKRLRDSYPKLRLHTHIIIGFPSETKDEFEQTLSFVKEVNFDSGIIFQYSPKIGTEAESIEPKIHNDEMSRRLKYSNKFLKNLGYNVFNVNNNHLLFLRHKLA